MVWKPKNQKFKVILCHTGSLILETYEILSTERRGQKSRGDKKIKKHKKIKEGKEEKINAEVEG